MGKQTKRKLKGYRHKLENKWTKISKIKSWNWKNKRMQTEEKKMQIWSVKSIKLKNLS